MLAGQIDQILGNTAEARQTSVNFFSIRTPLQETEFSRPTHVMAYVVATRSAASSQYAQSYSQIVSGTASPAVNRANSNRKCDCSPAINGQLFTSRLSECAPGSSLGQDSLNVKQTFVACIDFIKQWRLQRGCRGTLSFLVSACRLRSCVRRCGFDGEARHGPVSRTALVGDLHGLAQ